MAALSTKQRVMRLPREQRLHWLQSQPAEIWDDIVHDEWWWTARPTQVPPPGVWLIYLMLSGRGSGKTRTGSEWIISRTIQHPKDMSGAPTERLVVAETIADARNALIGGPSGMLRVLDRRGIRYRYYKAPKPHIVFLETGCIIHADGAEDADVGRSFNLADVWMDEFAKWRFPKESWREGIRPALRTPLPGDHPRALITTTPKPLQILRDWSNRNDGSVITIVESTFDNAMNLSTQALQEMQKEYEGTTLGQQELYGVILDDAAGNLFRQSDFNLARVDTAPPLVDTVVGIDPGLTGDGDETGIIVVGRDDANDWYILADASIKGVGREACLHAWRTYLDYGASAMVVETNLGRKWMVETFESSYHELVDIIDNHDLLPPRGTPPIHSVDSKAGKLLRAQPVGMRCEQRRIHPVGTFKLLEGQCIDYDPATVKDSPDRLDAFVHACLWHKRQEPRTVVIAAPTATPTVIQRTEVDQLLWGVPSSSGFPAWDNSLDQLVWP